MRRCGALFLMALIGGSGGSWSAASDGAAGLANVPPSATHLIPALQHVVDVVNSSLESQRKLKAVRTEQDAVKTKLATVAGELQLIGQHRQQLADQLAAMERQQQERLGAMRKELETKLEQEMAQASQQIAQELERDFAQQVQAFDARYHEAIQQVLDQELQLKERELQQLSREIEVQTQDLLDRLNRLNATPELSKTLQQSTAQALAKRKTELELRRQQLTAERDALLTKQRTEFLNYIRQQQTVERQRRLTLKEANLRSAMAELLHKARQDDAARVQQIRQQLDAVTQRYHEAAQQEAVLKSRLGSLDQEAASSAQRLQVLEAERQSSLAKLEQAFRRSPPGMDSDAIAWLGQAAQHVPAELATDLGLMQQRLTAVAEQERQLQEQRRVLRERQLALQLSQEMEAQYERMRLKQQQEQEARARRAEEFLAKARQLADRGKFDDALSFVAQAQAVNPPQLSQITAFREELLREQERAMREAQAAQIERTFARAKVVFEQGNYEEAVKLFEQVIEQEATLGTATTGASTP